jgi:hypothetical protein
MRPALPGIALLATLAAAACAEPPRKEMDRAQGAIEAARAAGAAQFATDELQGAVDALQRSEEAAAQRDYRLALDRALVSFSRAQAAANLAGEGRAKARGDAERALGELSTAITAAEARLREPSVEKLPRRATDTPRATIAHARSLLQDARSALEQGDYAAVTKAAGEQRARIREALAAIDAALAPPVPRKKR